MEEGIKDLLRWEMAMPENEIGRIQFARIFCREVDMKPNNDKVYVEFARERLVKPTSSPAPGRKKRSKESPNLPKQDF